jgi:eukaryotic-like serine/threonine-protein kinase
MAHATDHDPMTETPLHDRDERLGEAIEDYLALVESGSAPDADDFASRYPDLKDDLRAALDGLAMIQGLVGESGGGAGARLEAGRRVAGYRIVRELGRGGMGIVYEAVHVDLDRPVALKVLGMHTAPDSTGRRRFLNEAKTAAGLHHTHIVPVFDVGQVGGLCYYAMQRIEGCGLDRVVKALRKGRSTAAGSSTGKNKPTIAPEVAATIDLLNASSMGDPTRSWFAASAAKRVGGPVPNDERSDEVPPFEPPRGHEYYRWVARAGHQAADALAHAHRRGVIHRDVKPSNLLVDGRGTVWVADFGLARRISDPSLTQTESLIGTPRYMSPEQAVQGPIDVLTDVYSLGATLYELLTLRPPHDGRSTAELIGQIRDKEPISPRKLDARLPRDLETIVLKAMAKRPMDRYASAGDLADDLERFLNTEPVKARRISPIGRAWRFARRHPSLTAVSSIAAVSILATATIAYVRVVQEKNKAINAKAETETALDRLNDAMIQNLWREAESVRKMRVPDLRKTGLDRLKEAVAHVPDPAMMTKLRDEAVQFLAMRDIEPKTPIETGKTRGVVFAGSADRLVTLAEDGAELDVWMVGQSKPTARFPLFDATGNDSREANGGKPRSSFRFSAGLSASGSTVAVVRPRGDGVRFFDLDDNGAFHDIAIPGHIVANLILTADGRRLVTVDRPTANDDPRGPRSVGGGAAGKAVPGQPYRVWLWDPKRPDSPIASLALPEPKLDPWFGRAPQREPQIAASPDGKTIAVAAWLDSTITLYDGETGARRGEVAVEGGMVTCLALGADGTLAAAHNGTISRWDAQTQKPLPGLSVHQPIIHVMRFSPSPDGSPLAVAGSFNGVELWDPEANALLATVPTAERVGDLAFSSDGKSLSATVGKLTRVWTMVEPIGRSRLAAPSETKPASRLWGLASSPAGTIAATFSNTKTASARLQCAGGGLTARDHLRTLAVAFDPYGRLIVPDGDVLAIYAGPRDAMPELTVPLPASPTPDRLRDDASPATPRPGPAPADAPTIFAGLTSADGRTLALFRWSGDVLLVRFGEPGTPPTITQVRPPSPGDNRGGGGMRGPRIGPQGGAAITPGPGGPGSPGPGFGGPGGRGRGAPFGNPFGNPSTFALSPNGDRLYAVAGDRSEPRAWVFEGNRVREVRWRVAHHDVTKVAPSPDGRLVALGKQDGGVSIVSASDGTLLGAIPPPAEPDAVTALAFSREGELAVGSRSGLIRLWAIRPDGRCEALVTLPGQQGEVRALTYTPDGRRLAAGDDSGADVWDLDQVRKRLVEIGLGW